MLRLLRLYAWKCGENWPDLVAAVRIALRALDLDDVGAEVREHHSRARARDERALLDDADA